MAKKLSWPLIIISVAIFGLVVGVSLVAVAGYVIYQQFAFKATSSTEMAATDEFARVASRFAGQTPLLEIRDGEPVRVKERGPGSGKPVEALHIMVWEPDGGKIVRLNIPFWLLRMTKGRPIRLSGGPHQDDEPVRLKITAEDLERHGPGLILDYKDSAGQRVLIWAQ